MHLSSEKKKNQGGECQPATTGPARDSEQKAREAYLIERGKTLKQLGIN